MNKVMVVFKREYLAQVQSKTFLVTIVLMPVLMGGSILVQMLVGDGVDTKDRSIAIIDRTGKLYEPIRQLANQRNENDITDDEGNKVRPAFKLTQVEPAEDAAAQRLELSKKIKAKELDAFLDIGPGILGSAANDDSSEEVRYHSQSPTDREFIGWIDGQLRSLVLPTRFNEANLNAKVVSAAIRPVNVRNLGLMTVDESGNIKDAEESNRAVAFLMPFGFCMLMFMAVMISGPQMMQNIIEEKMQRIAEVLIGSIPPFQLMLGKLVGVIAVALTLLGIYLSGGYFVARYFNQADLLPLSHVAWMLGYGALAMFMFGAIFGGIGAACSEIKDAQTLITPVMLVVCLPLFLLGPIIEAPNGPLATYASFFPPATPMVMIMRMAVPPGVPTWQPWLGIPLVLAFSAFCVFAAGRVFRIGILMQGKPPKAGELAKWIVKG